MQILQRLLVAATSRRKPADEEHLRTLFIHAHEENNRPARTSSLDLHYTPFLLYGSKE